MDMNRNIEAVVNFLLILAIVLFVSCKKEQLDPVQTEQKVKVETSSVTQITSSSAIVGGDVTFDGGSIVRERGVCWSKTPSPIIGGNHESLGTGVGAFTYNLTELEPATNYYVRAYAINDAGINYGRVVGFSTLYKVSDGTCNGHDYVDLGLPSGTLWATCNVGANVPEEYGDLFAWGEVEPKSDYSWNTYKYCNNGNSHQLTKYCIYSDYGFNGFVDNMSTLQPVDDAAAANMGDGWCTPSYDQWVELISISKKWTRQNDVDGWLFTSSNGRSLFMPATGWGESSEIVGSGLVGKYWANSIYTASYNRASDIAWCSSLYGNPDNVSPHIESNISCEPRYFGYAIRAVISAN